MWGALLALGAAALAAGCAKPTQRPVIAVPAARSQGEGRPLRLLPPLGLTKDDDAVLRIVSDVTCTGTLIAEDLVLTAHHCVAERDADGRVLPRDKAPADLSIELGGDYLPWGEVSVRAVVSPDCGYSSGEGDIAILVLSRRLIGVSTMALRLDRGPSQGEYIAPSGFGRCATSPDAIHRVARRGGQVQWMRDRQFLAPASICPGDSGGPVCAGSCVPGPDGTLSCTGGCGVGSEVLGVISASVMDGDESTTGASFFTRVDAWRQLFSAAREIADGASPSELPPYRSCSW